MGRNLFTYGALALGAAGLIFAAAQAGQTPPQPAAPSAPGHEGHPSGSAGQPAPAPAGSAHETMGHHHLGMLPGMAGFEGSLATLNRPLVRSLFGAFLLPELQTELGLTADQVGQLKQLKADVLANGEDISHKIAAKERDLDALFSPDTSKGQQVKALLEQIAELRAQQHYFIYTTARKMKAILTEDQRTRLQAMQPEELRHATMARLTLEDFSKAIEVLRFAM